MHRLKNNRRLRAEQRLSMYCNSKKERHGTRDTIEYKLNKN